MAHADAAARATVFDVRQLAKVYRMGEVEVHALRDVTLSRSWSWASAMASAARSSGAWKEGQRVVLHPSDTLTDGARVAARQR